MENWKESHPALNSIASQNAQKRQKPGFLHGKLVNVAVGCTTLSPGRFSLTLEVWSHLQGQSQGKRPGDEVVGRTMTTCSIFRANVTFDCLQFSREQKRKTTILPDVSKHLLRKSRCHKYVFNFLSCKSTKKENWGVSWCNLRKLMFVSYDVVTWNWLLVWVF